jgi:hypothetical protein
MKPSTLKDVLLVMDRLPPWKLVLAMIVYNVVIGVIGEFSKGFLRGLGLI